MRRISEWDILRNMVKFLTTAQVAERLGRSVSTVNRLAKAGVIPVAQQGTGVRGERLFDPAVVEELEERAS